MKDVMWCESSTQTQGVASFEYTLPSELSRELQPLLFGYPNVWLGTSVEDQRVLERIEHLTSVPAVVHFLSLEPLLGPLPSLPLRDVEWVIVGGESGAKARPMREEWVLDIRRQCRDADVAFFFKQWGGVRKKAAGRQFEGDFYDELPIPTKRRFAYAGS